MGIATNVLGILKLATGASRIGRGESTVAADLTALESGQSTLNDTLTAEAGKVATLQRQVVPLARAVRVMMDASTTERGLLVSENDHIAFGNSAFTFYIATKPDGFADGDTFHFLLSNTESSASSDASPLIRFWNNGGDVSVQAFISVDGNYLATETLTVDEMNEAAVWTVSYTPPAVGVDGSIIFARNYRQFGDTVTVPAGAPYTFTGADILISSHRTTRESSDFYWSAILNRAHSIAEIESVGTNGFSSADIGSPGNRASQTSLVSNGDFDDGISYWVRQSGGTGGTSSVAAGVLTVSVTGANTEGRYQDVPTDAGKKYRALVNVTERDGGRVLVYDGGGYSTLIANNFVSGTGLQYVEFVALSSSTRIYIVCQNATSSISVGYCYLIHLGLIGLWSAEHAQSDTGQVLEQMHGSHGLLPSAGATIHPQPEGLRQVKATLTWNGDSTAKYLLSNQDILPDGFDVERVKAVVSGTPVDGTLGDSVDPDRYCTLAKNTGLVQGSNTLALSQRTGNGNNDLLWKPSAAFTGTIKFYIYYFVGEQ